MAEGGRENPGMARRVPGLRAYFGLVDAVAALERECARLTAALSSQEATSRHAMAAAAQAAGSERAALEARLLATGAELRDARAVLESLGADLDAAAARAAVAAREAHRHVQRTEALEAAHQQKTVRIEALESEATRLGPRIEALEHEASSMTRRLEQLEHHATDVFRRIQAFVPMLEGLASWKEEVTSELHAGANGDRNLRAQVEDVRRVLTAQTGRVSTSEGTTVARGADGAPTRIAVPAAVNLIGYLSAELGLGEAARMLATSLEAAGIQVARRDWPNLETRRRVEVAGHAEATPHPISIIAVNIDRIEEFIAGDGGLALAGKYTIGYWWWEVPALPAGWASRFAAVDEVWVGSEYVARILRPATTKPVHVVPLPLRPLRPRPTPDRFGLGKAFVALVMADMNSVVERKNPADAIRAFTTAFPKPGEARLVVRIVNGERRASAVATLRALAGTRPDVLFLEGHVDSDERDAWLAACDVYISLHRAEGWGLGLAEAMAAGKPCIATAYSGNLDFMDSASAELIPYHLVEVPSGCAPYPAGALWAQPNVERAAEALRRLHDDPAHRARLGRAAAAKLERHLGPDAIGPVVRERVAAAQARRLRTPLAWPAMTEAPTAWTAPQALARRVEALEAAVLRSPDPAPAGVAWLPSAQGTGTVPERLARLEGALRSPGILLDLVLRDGKPPRLGFDDTKRQPGKPALGLAQTFRDEAFVLQRARVYAKRLPPGTVDLGCGRGDLLAAMKELGRRAHGVDLDDEVVRVARSRGLDAEVVDATTYLEKCKPGSIPGLACIQVIEHLSWTEIPRLLKAARRALAPDASFIVETVNPHALAGFKGFFLDPTHRAIVYPQVLLALAREAGFTKAEIEFPDGTGELDDDAWSALDYTMTASAGPA